MDQIFQEAIDAIQTGLHSVLDQPHVVVLNLLAFLVLLFFVRKFFWGSITTFLEKRQEALTEAITKADEEKMLAEKLQHDAKEEYNKMKIETEELKDRLTKEAYLVQEELIEKAKLTAKRKVEQAEKDIQFEIEKANEDIKKAIKEVAYAAAEKIVKREVDESLHDDIMEDIIGKRFES